MDKFIEYFKDTSFVQPICGISPMTNWKEEQIKDSGEPLVALGAFSEYANVLTDSIYYGQSASSPYNHGELDGALITCFVRRTVAEKLQEAAELLPEGYELLVWDAYRPLSVQNTLFRDFVAELQDKRGMTKEEAMEFAPTFVNLASDDPKKPSPHHTGGSVDLTIIKFDDDVLADLKSCKEKIKSSDWKVAYEAEMLRQKLIRNHSHPIDVGANFDEATELSAVMYFEDKIAKGKDLSPVDFEKAMNRRIFQNILRSVGFSSFESEWWHVDFGNQFHAKQTGQIAQYGPVKLSDENKEHELMRVNHYKGTNSLSHKTRSKIGSGVFYPNTPQMDAALGGARHGSMTQSRHPIACKLEA